VAEVTPGGDSATAASASLLRPPTLAALVQLLSSNGSETQQEAASLVCLLLSRERDAAPALAAAGAGPALAELATGGQSTEARQLAAEALHTLQQRVGWRQVQQQAPAARQGT